MSPALPTPQRPTRRVWLWPGVALWVITLGFGLRMLAKYEFTPGAVGVAPSAWPASAPLQPDGVHPTLVLFLHPQCPCSKATVAELARLLGEVPNQFTAAAFIYSPAAELAEWTRSEIAETVRGMPGVRLQPDPDGKIAKQFGAMTSGQVMLFGRQGDIEFSGGITGSRGHEGDNAGRRAVVARISGKETSFTHTAVFGCSLVDETWDPTP
jgi:hypothetical protein